jgi:hypothetical protein
LSPHWDELSGSGRNDQHFQRMNPAGSSGGSFRLFANMRDRGPQANFQLICLRQISWKRARDAVALSSKKPNDPPGKPAGLGGSAAMGFTKACSIQHPWEVSDVVLKARRLT